MPNDNISLDINNHDDNPIQNEKQDRLDREGRAEEIVEEIIERFEVDRSENQPTTSYSFAIQGPWGEGKTSFINLVKVQLKKNKGIEIKEFAPWHFSDKCDIHEQFLSLIVGNKKNYLLWLLLGCYLILVVLSSSDYLDYYIKQWLSQETVQLILNFINKAIENLRATYLVPIVIIVYYAIIFPLNIQSLISKIGSIFSLNLAFDFINFSKEYKFNAVKTKEQLSNNSLRVLMR